MSLWRSYHADILLAQYNTMGMDYTDKHLHPSYQFTLGSIIGSASSRNLTITNGASGRILAKRRSYNVYPR